jgi:protein disulfide-isomerase
MCRRTLFSILLAVLGFSGVALGGDWQTDYNSALEKAKAENKRVLLDFTGSDWCGPCIQLNKEVLSRPEFLTYADKHLILVEIDYPQRKRQSPELVKQNRELGRQYGIDEKGYPTVILLDPAGKVVAEFTGYSGENAAEFIAWIEAKTKG